MTQGFRAGSEVAAAVSAALSSDFVLVDVGCAGGIDPGFRSFGERLRGYAFDASVPEIERLAAAETQRIDYRAALVGPDKPVVWPRWTERLGVDLASRHTVRRRKERYSRATPDELLAENQWASTRLATERVDLSAAAPAFDFLKIDIDGPDFHVLRSIESYDGVLGVGMEVNYFGTNGPDEHTFHNTDRFLRERGFDLYALSVRKYALATLPSKYLGPVPGPSLRGRPVQGDAIYFRDPFVGERTYARDELLKLVGLFALAEQYDAAAEVVAKCDLGIDRSAMLDLIAREAGVEGGYEAYIAAFERDDASFYHETWVSG